MTDPFDSLTAFQKALRDDELVLRPGELDPTLVVHADKPLGVPRMTYARLDGRKVIALAIMVNTEPLNGLPCFQAGVAVAKACRGKGHAKSITEAAIAEMKNGLARNGISSFYVEAIVNVENEPSKKVAAATISSSPVAVTDHDSGLPALQYLKKV
jgi:ribosomal protein S18 acetylase RimI-like enzyme